MATDEYGSFINYLSATRSENPARIVETEAIISSFRRMRKENYTMYIISDDISYPGLDDKISSNLTYNTTITYRDKDNNVKSGKKKFVKLSMLDRDLIFYNTVTGADGKIQNEQGLNKGVLEFLYEITKGKKYYEYIGIYQDKTDSSVSDVNKTTNKIITYVDTEL